MYIKLPDLITKYGIHVKGIIHVGAHLAEEDADYKACSVPRVVWVEPWKPAFDVISQKFSGDKSVKLINCAFGDVASNDVVMNIDNTNFGMSSSIMRPVKHLVEYPTIDISGKANIRVRKMDQFQWLRDGSYNFLNLDVQGYELKVLQGGIDTLAAIDYVYTEVNRDEIYEGCARIEQIDAFLREFTRVEVYWCHGGTEGTWGDAFYIRKK